MIDKNWPGAMVPDTLFKMTLDSAGGAFPLLQHFLCLGIVLMTTS